MAVALSIGGGGQVPGANAPGGTSSFSGPTVIPQMMDLYNQSLNLNQANYQNILGSYAGGQNRLSAALPDIYKGYSQLQGNVANTLGFGGNPWGVAAPAAAEIGRSFAQTQGQTQQDLINRGLGNSSVLGNMSNQNTLMAGQAYAGLGAQLAQTYAGYESQLGLAGLGSQMQGLGMQTDLAKAQGSTLGGYRFQSPSQLVGQYSQGNFPQHSFGGSAMMSSPSGGGYRRGLDNAPYADGGGPGASTGFTGGYGGSGGGGGYNPFTHTGGNPVPPPSMVGGTGSSTQPSSQDRLDYPTAYGFNNPDTGTMIGSGVTTDTGPQNPYNIDLG